MRFFLNIAKNNNWEAYGVDTSQYLSGYAREKFNLNVFTGSLEKSGFVEEYFDVVTMFDLLSHLRSPSKTLKEVSRILKNQGLLVIKGGNKGNLKTKKAGDSCWGTPDHLYHFSRETMRELLEKSEFKIVKMYSEAVMPGIFNHKNFIYRYKSIFAKPYRLFRKAVRSSVGRILGYFPVDSIVMVYAVKDRVCKKKRI